MDKNTTIGWIGTGVMGTSMVGHLHKAGYKCIVYNRTKAKAEKLLAEGVSWANSPGEVAANSDVIFTIVGFPKDVREVYFGENGILNSAKPGAVLIDMTTTEPSLSVEIYEAAKAKNIQSIDAPVSGGDVGAQNATLSIMVGGEEAAVEQIRPLFELLGKSIVNQGAAGSGQHTKMCNQITIAGTMIGVCESLLYGHKAGLDLPIMLSSISGGAAGCWTLNNLAPRIVVRNFDPGFFVEHFIKDMGIALKEAESMGLSLPGLALVQQLYLSVQAQGHGKLGTHALTLALEKMSGM
ncbi:NAD(P)-dependent oxidoreductase [uncultured Draconibacterium sp.]|uniref:NAD(P)-dependent oxidoreductase n=1 Tax=uncultured Draconibacterium sp. TaxID=1573823 RepID=UPI0032169B33